MKDSYASVLKKAPTPPKNPKQNKGIEKENKIIDVKFPGLLFFQADTPLFSALYC